MKATVERKRFNNLYSKIDKIAKKGNLGLVEYKKLVNDTINDGQFYILTSVLERKYKIDVDKYTNPELKENIVYDQIRFVTNSKYSEDSESKNNCKSAFANLQFSDYSFKFTTTSAYPSGLVLCLVKLIEKNSLFILNVILFDVNFCALFIPEVSNILSILSINFSLVASTFFLAF